MIMAMRDLIDKPHMEYGMSEQEYEAACDEPGCDERAKYHWIQEAGDLKITRHTCHFHEESVSALREHDKEDDEAASDYLRIQLTRDQYSVGYLDGLATSVAIGAVTVLILYFMGVIG